jgi:hypothetical protein
MAGAAYWDSQQRLGQVRLSDRDTVLVSLVSKADRYYVRLRVHRRELSEGVTRSVPGNQGLIVPVAAAADLAALLRQVTVLVPTHGFARLQQEE